MTRIGHVALHDSVTLVDGRELEVPGAGRIPLGRHRTERGTVGLASFAPGVLLVVTTENDAAPRPADAPVALAELRDSVRRVLGADLPLGEPVWLTHTSAQARLADRLRVGRVFVSGDAAHLFPAGGLALNVDLLDAVNLGWKLAAAVHGRAPAGLLDSYDAERRPVAARTLMHARASAAVSRADGADGAALRTFLGELLRDREPLRRLAGQIKGSDHRYDMSGVTSSGASVPDVMPDGSLPGGDAAGAHPLVGYFVPDLHLVGENGVTRVAELMRAGRPVLLDLAGRVDLVDAVAGWRDRVDVHTVRCGESPADALLVRPDAHVAWAAPAGGADDLRRALASWFGLSLP